MTGNIWIDLQLSFAEAEIPDIPDELPRIPTVGNAMGQRRLRWRSTTYSNPSPKITQTATIRLALSYTVRLSVILHRAGLGELSIKELPALKKR